MLSLDADNDTYRVRREWLKLSIGALGALLLDGFGRQGLASVPPLTWDEFATDLVPRAERMFRQQSSEAEYISSLADRLRRLDPRLIPSRSAFPVSRYFMVQEFRFPPGKGFHYHDHRDHNGVVLVTEGRVRIKSFVVVSGAGTGTETENHGGKVLIRETRSRVYAEREVSSLTTTRDNIHDVRGAETGCRLLDVLTWTGPNPKSVFLDVDSVPFDKAGRLFKASFVEE